MMNKYSDDYYYDLARVNIRKYRKEKNYTQQELADKANLSMDYICEIESTKKNKSFSIATLGRIANALDIEIQNFFE